MLFTRCLDNNSLANLKSCVDGYIADTLECAAPWEQRLVGNNTCEGRDVFQKYQALSKDTKSVGEQGLYLRTGCSSNCRRPRYTLKPRHSETKFQNTDKESKFKLKIVRHWSCQYGNWWDDSLFLTIFYFLQLTLNLYYSGGKYDSLSQYYTYGTPDFIADIGGYLESRIIISFNININKNICLIWHCDISCLHKLRVH